MLHDELFRVAIRIVVLPSLIAATVACQSTTREPDSSSDPNTGNAVLFEGARLIPGDGTGPIEDSVLVVEGGRFVNIGTRGEVQPPAGARRIDLRGKTIIPALVDLHAHPGYLDLSDWTSRSIDSYTRDNLIDYLNRYAYYGIGAIVGLGTDSGDLAFLVREQQRIGELGGAMLYTAGRGLGSPNAGSGDPVMRPIAYDVDTEEQARISVQDLSTKGPNLVKIYVDDRNGTVPKLRPELYRAIIDEAHKHSLLVVAHMYYLADAKDLVRAGVDGFSHLPRDQEADDELVSLMKDRSVFVIPSLSQKEFPTIVERPTWFDEPSLRETVPPAVLDQWTEALATRDVSTLDRERRAYGNVRRGLSKLNRAGVRIAFGSDYTAIHVYGFSEHRELELMVAAGMTPSQVIIAATRTSADILGLNTGVIEPDKSADFLVLDRNPLDDIANSRQIDRVFLRGEEVDRAALRANWNSILSP